MLSLRGYLNSAELLRTLRDAAIAAALPFFAAFEANARDIIPNPALASLVLAIGTAIVQSYRRIGQGRPAE